MAAALVQNGRLMTRYDRLRLTNTKYHILAPTKSPKQISRDTAYHPSHCRMACPTGLSRESTPVNLHSTKNHRVRNVTQGPLSTTYATLQESTRNNNDRKSIIQMSGIDRDSRRNNQRKNQYQKVHVGEQICEKTATVLIDHEGYVLVPQRTREVSSFKMRHLQYQYQMAQVKQYSREKDAPLPVLGSYGVTKRNDGDYFLAKREPRFHKSLKKTPAKSDNSNTTNSADCNNINNTQNYYEVLGSNDDDDSERITIPREATERIDSRVTLHSVALENSEAPLSKTVVLREEARKSRGRGTPEATRTGLGTAAIADDNVVKERNRSTEDTTRGAGLLPLGSSLSQKLSETKLPVIALVPNSVKQTRYTKQSAAYKGIIKTPQLTQTELSTDTRKAKDLGVLVRTYSPKHWSYSPDQSNPRQLSDTENHTSSPLTATLSGTVIAKSTLVDDNAAKERNTPSTKEKPRVGLLPQRSRFLQKRLETTLPVIALVPNLVRPTRQTRQSAVSNGTIEDAAGIIGEQQESRNTSQQTKTNKTKLTQVQEEVLLSLPGKKGSPSHQEAHQIAIRIDLRERVEDRNVTEQERTTAEKSEERESPTEAVTAQRFKQDAASYGSPQPIIKTATRLSEDWLDKRLSVSKSVQVTTKAKQTTALNVTVENRFDNLSAKDIQESKTLGRPKPTIKPTAATLRPRTNNQVGVLSQDQQTFPYNPATTFRQNTWQANKHQVRDQSLRNVNQDRTKTTSRLTPLTYQLQSYTIDRKERANSEVSLDQVHTSSTEVTRDTVERRSRANRLSNSVDGVQEQSGQLYKRSKEVLVIASISETAASTNVRTDQTRDPIVTTTPWGKGTRLSGHTKTVPIPTAEKIQVNKKRVVEISQYTHNVTSEYDLYSKEIIPNRQYSKGAVRRVVQLDNLHPQRTPDSRITRDCTSSPRSTKITKEQHLTRSGSDKDSEKSSRTTVLVERPLHSHHKEESPSENRERTDTKLNSTNTKVARGFHRQLSSKPTQNTTLNIQDTPAGQIDNTMTDSIMQSGRAEENGSDKEDVYMGLINEHRQSDDTTGNDDNNMETGLTEAVDLTLTEEEIEFKEKTVQPIDPTAYAHQEVIAQRKNEFPKNYINDGRQTIIDHEDDYYCHLTPMTVRIQSIKKTTYRLERVLYSILLALQHSDPTARLMVWDYYGDEDFATLNQARRCSDLRPDNVKDFIEEPTTNFKSHSFSGRICLLSEVTLTEIKQDEVVRTWLNKERVYLSENSLSTATTAAVGIITGWIPRNLPEVHTARIRNEIATAPEFLTEYKWLSDGANVKAKFIVIRAAERDVQKLVNRLTAMEGKMDFTFHPWNHIMSLSKHQKRHLIQTEANFQQQHYSLLIKNLKTGIDDVTMQHTEKLSSEEGTLLQQSTMKDDNIQTVRAFLTQHYRTWDGHALFKTVHKEASGVIEVLTIKERFTEAKGCIDQIRQDLTCYMTAAAIKASFTDYKLLQSRADSHIRWTAIDLSSYAASENKKQETATTKRQRTDTSKATYSNVTKSNTGQKDECLGGRRRPGSSDTVMKRPEDNKLLIELQCKNKDLETKVTELKEIVKESQASMTSSIEQMLRVMNQKNTSRNNDIDNKVEELDMRMQQSQSMTTTALRDIRKDVGTNGGVVQHLMTKIIPVLQNDLKETKSILEQKMDDGFSGIRNMFEHMMQQNNSLHRADGETLVDVTHKRNRSSSKSRKSHDGSGKMENTRAESNSRRRSGDSRENDNLEHLTHSDHHMTGTGDQP